MKERTLAKRYGKALFDLAVESGNLEEIEKEVLSLAGLAKILPSFTRALADERIPFKQRIQVIGEIARILGLTKPVVNLTQLIVTRRKIGILSLIAENFEARAARLKNLKLCRATVAFESDADAVRKQIVEILNSKLKTNAVCEVGADKDLIGGFVANIGDVRYDASLKGQMERMKEELFKETR